MAKLVKPVVLETKSKHDSVVIWLHGLGDSGEGWRSTMEEIQQRTPNTKYVLPNAPIQPVTLNGGMKMRSWHDIKSLSTVDASDFKGLDESKKVVEDLINAEITAGIASDRIILGGFSQGAALSLYTGYQFGSRLAGIIALSGYLPYSGDFSKVVTANKETPSLICHGDIDGVVALKMGQRAHKILQEAKIPTTFNLYKNMEHSSSPQEIRDVLSFIQKQLPKSSNKDSSSSKTEL